MECVRCFREKHGDGVILGVPARARAGVAQKTKAFRDELAHLARHLLTVLSLEGVSKPRRNLKRKQQGS